MQVETPIVKLLTQTLMDTVAQQARTSPRRRQNYNFHSLSERVQRFLNVLQPGTYVRPHCHLRSPDVNGFEFFLVLQGALGMLVLDAEGNVLERQRVSAQGEVKAIELPEGTYHTLIALEADTVMLELKEGPYSIQTDKLFLTNFPEEGTPAAAAQVELWERYFSDQPPPADRSLAAALPTPQ